MTSSGGKASISGLTAATVLTRFERTASDEATWLPSGEGDRTFPAVKASKNLLNVELKKYIKKGPHFFGGEATL